MWNKKLITLFIVITSFSGIAIIDRIQSSKQPVPEPSFNKVVERRFKYTGIVAKVDNIAEQITVRIATSTDSYGSGVILARKGNTYYVATAGHVVDKAEEYKIITPDGKTYQLDKQNIVRSDAYDLAIFSFESERNYTVATIGNYAIAKGRDQAVFVSGFANLAEKKNIRRIITGGKVFGKLGKNAAGLMYRNISYPGMSGGAILDREGRLVGINVGADEQLLMEDDGYENVTIGFSSGIPMYEDILGFLTTQTQLKTGWLNTKNNPATEISKGEWNSITLQLLLLDVNRPDNLADSIAWMNYGNRLWRYEKYSEAIEALETAVAINPNLDRAYYTMGLIYEDQDRIEGIIEALETAVEINPNISPYWHLLGASYDMLSDYERRMTPVIDNEYKRVRSAYEQGIAVNPQDTVLYIALGWAWRESASKGNEEAIASISKAIEINPNLPRLYNERANTYRVSRPVIFLSGGYEKALADYEKASADYDKANEKALADYEKAISLNPLYVRAYNNRGSFYKNLQQYENALADYSKAISIDPNYALPYHNRGNIYYSLGQYGKALADYNKAILINPKYVDAYRSRSHLYTVLKECEKVEADLQRLKELEEVNPKINPKAEIVNNCGKDHYSEKYDSPFDAIGDLSSISPDPQFAKSYKYRGDAYIELYRHDRVLADYNQAISLNPNYLEAYRSRADYYANYYRYSKNSSKTDQILADYTQIIAINPQDISAYMSRGNTYSVLGQDESALADYSKAISINPEFTDAYYSRSLIYSSLGQDEKAEADRRRISEIDPLNSEGSAVIHNKSGRENYHRNEYEKAVNDFTQAISIYPQFAEAYKNRGDAYSKLERYNNALADYDKAISLDPKYTEAYEARVLNYERIKQYDRVIADYTQIIAIDPKDNSAYKDRASLYRALEQYDKAIADYTKAIAIDPENGSGYFSRAKIYEELEQYDKAIADVTAIIAINPDEGYRYAHRASLYKELGQYDKVIADHTQAIAIEPQNISGYALRGEIYEELGQYDKAIADYTQVIAIDPDNSFYARRRARVYLHLAVRKLLIIMAITVGVTVAYKYNLPGVVYRRIKTIRKGDR